LGLLSCKNRLPYNLYCVGGDVNVAASSWPYLLTLMSMTDCDRKVSSDTRMETFDVLRRMMTMMIALRGTATPPSRCDLHDFARDLMLARVLLILK